MNNTLNLLIHEHWPQQERACVWWLSDARGQTVHWGRGEPSQWPFARVPGQAAECRVFLYGNQLACHYARLPSKDKACTPAVIAAALEEELLTPPEGLAFVLAPMTAEGQGARAVLSVSRGRLQALRTLLAELGLSLRAAWPLAFCLAPGQACVVDKELTLRLPDGGLLALPVAAWPTWQARMLALGVEGELPCFIPPVPGLVADESPAWAPYQGTWAAPVGPGFLYGDLAPPAKLRAWLAYGRPVLRLLTGVGAAALLLLVAQTLWLHGQAGLLRSQIEADFRRIHGQTPLVDALRQSQRLMDSARRQAGQLADDDFLRLLHVLASQGELPSLVQQLDYEPGQLRATLALSSEQGARLQAAARAQGVSARQDGKTWILSAP